MLDEITRVCREEKVRLGWVEALGAVSRARIAYYDQQRRECRFVDVEKNLEITKFVGNVSLKDEESMVNAHVTLTDEEGRTYGGHLAPGTVVFVG